LPDAHRESSRRTAIAAALHALSDSRVWSGVVLLSAVGFADPEAITRLDDLIRQHDDDLGDLALAARTRLAAAPDAVPRLRDELHRRIPSRWNLSLTNAARFVGDSRTVDLVFSEWLARGTEVEDPISGVPMFEVALGVLTTICQRHSSDGLPGRTWVRLLDVLGRTPGTLFGNLDLNKSLAPGFDTPAVIPELLARAASAEGLNRWRLYERLADCVRPGQSAGWDEAPRVSLDAIRDDATRASGMTGNWATIQLDQKLSAWSTLLALGRGGELPSFQQALDDEGSGHVVSRLLDMAACVGTFRLPDSVGDILCGRPPAGREWQGNELFAAHVAAIHAAHGAGTREAFDRLLGFAPIRDGVLLSLIEALSDTADGLAQAGDRGAIERLLAAAEGDPTEHTRAAAAGAVADPLSTGS
jgi:hypothetical protein